jgi:outer membrane protein OmpA-like peptidoglycan-associated protein
MTSNFKVSIYTGSLPKRNITDIPIGMVAFGLVFVIAMAQGCVSNASDENGTNGIGSTRTSNFLSQGIRELDKALAHKKSENNGLKDEIPKDNGTEDAVSEKKGLEIPEKKGPDNKELKNVRAESEEYSLDGITFILGSARMEPSSDKALTQLLTVLKKYESVHIRLEGYCVQQQNSKANLKVSHQRATAVANYLKENGINGSRIRVVGRGDSRRKPMGSVAKGMSQNELIGLIVEKY